MIIRSPLAAKLGILPYFMELGDCRVDIAPFVAVFLEALAHGEITNTTEWDHYLHGSVMCICDVVQKLAHMEMAPVEMIMIRTHVMARIVACLGDVGEA